MNYDGTDDRLLHAKKLLKKYQNKNSVEGNDKTTRVEAEDANRFETTATNLNVVTSNLNSCASQSPSIFNESLPYDMESLRTLYNDKNVELTDALEKLQQLHNSYTELYAAYNVLSQSASSNTIAPEYALQISQLQTALAVAIEEKTHMQSQLRDLSSILNVLQQENAHYKESSHHTISLSAKYESEITALKEERARLLETISNQSVQIKSQRKECSELEAKILLIHQDRNETQARLKYLYEEKKNMEQEFSQLKSDLSMKEIYIRQLHHFSENNNLSQEQQVIKALTEEKMRVNEKFIAKENELSEMKKQFQSSCEHYDRCVNELRQQILSSEEEISRLNAAKTDLESIKSYQEEQIKLLKATFDSLKKKESTPMIEDSIDVSELQERCLSLENDLQRGRERIQDLEKTMEQRDSQLESLQCDYINLQQKISDLEDALKLQMSINSDVGEISAQLQNEKATVSRAVEQNLQLKNQLEELQNKIIMVTNECAAKEDEQITAMNHVKSLKLQLEKAMKHHSGPSDDNIVTASNGINDIKQTTTDSHVSSEQSEDMEKVDDSNSNSSYSKGKLINDGTMDNKSADENYIDSPSAEKGVNNSSNIYECTNCSNNNISKAQENIQLNERRKLEERLQCALNNEVNLKKANERLEYLLAALEMENESIGEFIALYRYQRANLQQKIRLIPDSVKEKALSIDGNSSFTCEGNVVSANGIKCTGCVECRGELVDL